MAGKTRRQLQLGDWRISPRQNLLTREGQQRRLEPKTMDVLLCLVARAGEVVSPEEILAGVWPGRVVEPSGIHQRVYQIRRALGDDARQPRYLESVPGRGYRIMTRVHDATPVEAGTDHHLTVAVMWLQDLSPDGALAWLSAGLTEELRAQIAGWPYFTVLPGTYCPPQQNIPPAGVDLLVAGYVQDRSPGVSVRLNLIDPHRQKTIWTRRFEGAHENPLELQLQIAESIARFFGESAGGNPAPANPQAYGAFLRLLNCRYFGAFDEHAYWLERVLELDPDWSWGWGDLAITYIRCASMQRAADLLDRATSIVRSTPRSEEADGILGLAEFSLKAYVEGDIVGARDIAVKLLSAGYSYPYATMLVSCGLYSEAAQHFRSYAERKSYRPVAWEWLAVSRGNAGDWTGALDAAGHVVRLFPSDAPGPPVVLSWFKFEAGRIGEAEALLAELNALRQRQKEGSVQRRVTEVLGYYNLAFRLAESRGDRKGALASAEWFREHGFHLHAGILYLRLQDRRAEEMIASADPRFDRYFGWVTSLMIPPDLSKHPLLEALGARFGFTDRLREELRMEAAEFAASGRL